VVMWFALTSIFYSLRADSHISDYASLSKR
jgi:hypothetical protein